MAPQAYKAVNTHAYEIPTWKLLSRLIPERAPHIGGMNGDVQFDLDTLAFKSGEQLEDFYSIIIRLQQEINLYGETVSTTRLIFQYMKAL